MSTSLRISLCVIARDEEAMLADCLASAKDLVDEMIVLDTGSTDKTAKIAAKAGATVRSFDWDDDFAQARNAALALATGDWVLILDADERLAPGSAKKIRAALEKSEADFDCGLLRLHDASSIEARHEDVLSGAARLEEPTYVARLLRRNDELAFEGIVHENVRRWILQHGNRQFDADGDIVHLGAIGSVRSAGGKSELNIRLLEERLESTRKDFTIFGHLAHERLALGEIEAAWAHIEQGWKLLKRASPSTQRSALKLTAARTRMQFQRGAERDVLATIDVAEGYEGRQPDLSFCRGRAHEGLALRSEGAARKLHLERAEAAYHDALDQRNQPTEQRLVHASSSWAAANRLGTVKLLQGAPAEAVMHYQSALSANPELEEAKDGLAEAAICLGEPLSAMEQLEPRLGDEPGAWLLTAAAADEHGDIDLFKGLFAEARRRSGEGYREPHHKLLHGTLNDELGAYLGEPKGGRGAVGTATAIMAGDKPEPRQVNTYERRQLRCFIRNMLKLEHTETVQKLLSDDADTCLPGVGALVTDIGKALGLSISARP